MRDVFSIEENHDPLIAKKEKIVSPKNFPANPSYHRSENGFVDQSKEKKSDNIMCMIGEITYIDDLSNFDQYDDDYVLQTEANLVEKSTVGLWEEVQFQQLENSDQLMHISYDSDEESLENFEVSEGYLPLFFT